MPDVGQFMDYLCEAALAAVQAAALLRVRGKVSRLGVMLCPHLPVILLLAAAALATLQTRKRVAVVPRRLRRRLGRQR